MDFILGIIIVIVLIFIVINYVSISVSNESGMITKCNTNSKNSNNNNNTLIPQPIDSKSNNSITGKYNLRAQMDDYNKQFYLSPYN
jgi:hypothetical protein